MSDPTQQSPSQEHKPQALPLPPPEMGYFPGCGPPKPDARWHRARLMVEGWRPGAGCDDWVRRAQDFQRRLRELADDPVGTAKLAEFDPDVFAAHAVYGSGDALAKGALEAWLLTGLPDAEVARECGLTSGAVGAYHELFFDVRGRLAATIWLVCNAIGKANLFQLAEGDVGPILRWLGRFGGPLLLRGALDYYRVGLGIPANLSGMGAGELNRLRVRLAARAVILSLVLPVEEMRHATSLGKLVRELGALNDGRPVVTAEQGPEMTWSALAGRVEATGTELSPGVAPSGAATGPGGAGRRRGGVARGG